MGFEQLPPPVDRSAAAAQVKAPAIALMVVGGLNLLLQLVSLLINLVGAGMSQVPAGLPPDAERFARLLGGTVGIGLAFVGLLISGLIVFGAVKMMNLANYALAMTSAILAIVCVWPCCCPIGLPFGIWALVVLFNANVKAAFGVVPRWQEPTV